MTHSEIWWNWVAGPSRFIKDISKEILNENSCIILIEDDFPWRNDMRNMVEREMHDYGKKVFYLDVEDSFKHESIGHFIIDLIDPISLLDYKAFKQSIEQYIEEKGILDNAIVWVKGIPNDQSTKWIQYIKNSKFVKSQIIIEIADDNQIKKKHASSKRVKIINNIDYISLADTMLFTQIIARQKNIDYNLISYYSSVATNLCGKDAQVASELINDYDLLRYDAMDSLKDLLLRKYNNHPRGKDDDPIFPHPFYLIRNEDYESLNQRLWKAQTEIIFPIIEEERITLIKKYKNELGEICPNTDIYGNVISSIFDIDIGHLVHLINTHSKNKPKIKVISTDLEFKRISQLREVRNKIAHAKILLPEECSFSLKNSIKSKKS